MNEHLQPDSDDPQLRVYNNPRLDYGDIADKIDRTERMFATVPCGPEGYECDGATSPVCLPESSGGPGTGWLLLRMWSEVEWVSDDRECADCIAWDAADTGEPITRDVSIPGWFILTAWLLFSGPRSGWWRGGHDRPSPLRRRGALLHSLQPARSASVHVVSRFDDAPESVAESIEAKFREFHAENPQVYRELVKRARQIKEKGFDRYSIKTLYEVIRWNAHLTTSGEPFKLNNSFTSLTPG